MVEEGEQLQIKGPENIFNKIIEENFPNLKNDIPMKVQEAYRTLNRLDQKKKKPSPCHIIIKTQNIQIKERILRAAKEKGKVTYKGKPIRLTPDFSKEAMKASSRGTSETKRPWMQTQTTIPSQAIVHYQRRKQMLWSKKTANPTNSLHKTFRKSGTQ